MSNVSIFDLRLSSWVKTTSPLHPQHFSPFSPFENGRQKKPIKFESTLPETNMAPENGWLEY